MLDDITCAEFGQRVVDELARTCPHLQPFLVETARFGAVCTFAREKKLGGDKPAWQILESALADIFHVARRIGTGGDDMTWTVVSDKAALREALTAVLQPEPAPEPEEPNILMAG